jgi:mono/diheme cytochrome c family protein
VTSRAALALAVAVLAAAPAAGAGTAPPAGAAAAKQLFRARCGTCHTLADAKTHGRVGPNLDRLKPGYAQILRQVTHGGRGGLGSMPRFSDQLTKAQIAGVSRYVAWAVRNRR